MSGSEVLSKLISSSNVNSMDIEVDHCSCEWEITSHDIGNAYASWLRENPFYFKGGIDNIRWQVSYSFDIPSSLLTINLLLDCSRKIQVNAALHLQINGKRQVLWNNYRKFSNGTKCSSAFSVPELSRSGIRVPIVFNLSQELSYAKYYETPDGLTLCFSKMPSREKFSDISLETDDGTVFPVHRIILYSRSPVFRATLESDEQKTGDHRIRIPDFAADTVKDLINYMYSDRIPEFHCSSAAELLRLAGRYQISDLASICLENLALNLCLANAVQLLLLANTYNGRSLKQLVLNFISANRLHFVDTTKFNLIKHAPDLLLDVIRVLAKSDDRQNRLTITVVPEKELIPVPQYFPYLR